MERVPGRISAWKITGVTALAGVALALVAAHFLDWNMLREPVSRRISAALDRPVVINGDLSVRLSLHPRIVARDVVLGNAPWSGEPDMARVGVLDFTVDAMSLLRRRIVLPHVIVSDARVLLEKNADGVPNWDFGGPGPSSWGTPYVGRMTIDRGHVEFSDPGARTRITVEADTEERASENEPYRLRVAARGSFRGIPSRLDGEVGSVLDLRNKKVPYPIKLRGAVGATRASVDGVLLDPMDFGGEDVRFELAGADLAELLPIIGVPLPPTPAYKLAGRLERKGKVWMFRGFRGAVGHSDLEGDFKVDREAAPQLITAKLTSQSLDMKDLGGFVGARRGDRPSPQPPRGDRVLPREPFDLDRLRIADFDVSFRGQHITTARLPLEDMSARLKVKSGTVTLEPLNFGVAGGNLVSNVTMDARGDVVRTRATIAVRKVKLEQLLPGVKNEKVNTGVVTGRARLDTTGNSIAAMLAGSNGRIGLMMEGGSVSELLTRLSHLDIAHALPMWLTGDRQLPVRCMGTQLEGRGGRYEAKALVLDTDKAKITGEGYVDFASESLELKLVAKPKDFSLVALRGPIVVSGPFSKPVVRAEMGNAVGRGTAAVVLGFVTGGPGALLPLLEFGGEKDSDCGALVRGLTAG